MVLNGLRTGGNGRTEAMNLVPAILFFLIGMTKIRQERRTAKPTMWVLWSMWKTELFIPLRVTPETNAVKGAIPSDTMRFSATAYRNANMQNTS